MEALAVGLEVVDYKDFVSGLPSFVDEVSFPPWYIDLTRLGFAGPQSCFRYLE